MGTATGTLRQDFTVKIDMEKLRDFITDKVIEAIADDATVSDVDIDESYLEDDELVITGAYSTRYKHWWCRGTLESPPESEYDRTYIDIGENGYLLDRIADGVKELLSVKEVKEDEDDVRFEDEEW